MWEHYLLAGNRMSFPQRVCWQFWAGTAGRTCWLPWGVTGNLGGHLHLHSDKVPGDRIQEHWLLTCHFLPQRALPKQISALKITKGPILKGVWFDHLAHSFSTWKYRLWGHKTGGLAAKNPPANAEDIGEVGLILGSGKSPGGENGSPLQYSCLGNPMDRKPKAGYSPWGLKSWTGLATKPPPPLCCEAVLHTLEYLAAFLASVR